MKIVHFNQVNPVGPTLSNEGIYYAEAGKNGYWDDSRAYVFSEPETVQLENLGNLMLSLLGETLSDSIASGKIRALEAAISPAELDVRIQSWKDSKASSAYGRYDFGVAEDGTFKLFEFNAETPVCLLEAGYIQYLWASQNPDIVNWPDGDKDVAYNSGKSYQWNLMYEQLRAMFDDMRSKGVRTLLLTCLKGQFHEYESSCTYLQEIALQSGLRADFATADQISIDSSLAISYQDRSYDRIFSLYPTEWMIQDLSKLLFKDTHTLLTSNEFVNKPYRLLLGSKWLLPELWRTYQHTQFANYLIPAWHTRQECLNKKVVAKSWWGRIGTEVEVLEPGQATTIDGPVIYQQYLPQKLFDGRRTTIGVWHIHHQACGMMVRDHFQDITTDECTIAPQYTVYGD